jgi:hypothetical protein
MCDRCQRFATPVAISTLGQLQSLHASLCTDGLRVLEIIDGSLQWSDHIECKLQCAACHQQFTLSCETYHGGGGSFGPIA